MHIRLRVVFAVLVFFVIVINGWVDEDSCITFRQISNLVSGYGMRYNIAERVQAFTHPLWFFLCTIFHLVTGEVIIAALLCGGLCSLAATLMLFLGAAKDIIACLVAFFGLIFSQAFIHYSTSGLENSLSHLLIVCICVAFLSDSQMTGRRIFFISVLTSFLAVNRLDTYLMVAPALLYVLIKYRSKETWLSLILGMFPLVLWVVFSTIYFGFPFPNTYYAKLHTGISKSDLYSHGLNYLMFSLKHDPTTLTSIVLAILLGLRSKNPRILMLLVGIILYLLYIIGIGGDYMSGRFLSTVMVLSICCLAYKRWQVSHACLVIGILVVPALLYSRLPLTTPLTYSKYQVKGEAVVDKQLYFYRTQGMPALLRQPAYKLRRQLGMPSVAFTYGLGMQQAQLPFALHIVDDIGLVDPLLARLPKYGWWRPGHYTRQLPLGYDEVLRGERKELCDHNLERLRKKLQLVTQGEIFSIERFRAILDLNLNDYDPLIDKKFYANPIVETTEDIINSTPENDCRHFMPNAGMGVKLTKLHHETKIAISSLGGEPLRVLFYRDGNLLGEKPFRTNGTEGSVSRLFLTTLQVPQQAYEEGYNYLKIIPHGRAKSGNHKIGQILFR